MVGPLSDQEISDKVDEYKKGDNWEDRKEAEEYTGAAIRTLVRSIVDHYPGRAGTAELTTLLRICQIESRAKKDTKKKRVEELEIPREDKEQVQSLIEQGRGVVGAGKGQIRIPDRYEEDCYQFLHTLIESDEQEVLDAAIEEFASLNIDGIQAGVLSPILYFLHPTRYPIINHASREGMEKIKGEEVSPQLSDYTNEAIKFREFSDEFALGGEDGDLRDVDWFFYQIAESGVKSKPTVWVEKTAIHGDYKRPGGSELSIGSAVLSPKKDAGGRDIYWALREAEIGDIVVHILQDRREILGASVIESELITDYDFPDPVERRWEQHQRDEGGYLRWLADFMELSDPPDLDDDFLKNPQLRQDLDQINRDNSGIFYTKERKLVQGGYLSKCPEPLADLLANSSSELKEYFRRHGYDVEHSRDRFCNSLSADPQVFQVPLSAGEMQENFDHTVTQNVPVNSFSNIVSTEFETDSVRVWGGGANAENANSGDLLLFGDRQTNEYTHAATILDTKTLSETQAREFCDAIGWRFGEPYRYIVFLDEVYEIGLDAPAFWELMDYDGFPYDGFSRIYPKRIKDYIIQNDTYGSVDAFLEDIAIQKIYPGTSSDTQYFWINSSRNDWYQKGGEVFYTTTAPDGSKRRNQSAYELANPGDEVLVYQMDSVQEIVGRAHVSTGLHMEESEAHGEIAEGITITWDEQIGGVSWDRVTSDRVLAESTVVESDNSYVVTELTEEEFDRILELSTTPTFSDYTDELEVSEDEITVDNSGLYFPEAEWRRIQSRVESALAEGNHVLLFGPPGTGKTKLARQVCEATVGKDQYELVTASADWSTFDTVGGYQTTSSNTLEFEPGVILDRFHADADGKPANEWLVIDELNRADIDKAFGSLFSALTGESVTLPFDGADGEPIEIIESDRMEETIGPGRFFIPEDWRMLATMNTLDKTSLYEMSYAFMRRWAFIPVGVPDLPDQSEETDSELVELVESYVEVWAEDDSLLQAEHHYEPVGRIWRAVNEERAIGPAIVEDIYEHVAAAPSREEADYVSPIIMYIFPQLEGLRRPELEHLIGTLDSIVDDDTGELWTVARDFFQLDLQQGNEE